MMKTAGGAVPHNLILCGFMGCGKTTVGRRLAAVCGRRFVDMDEYIAEAAGRPVPVIFEEEGEAGFRRRERAACRALSEEAGLIIATGGGAVTFAENVRILSADGVIVLLDVPPEALLRRLAGDAYRPLLSGPDKESRLRRLYAERLPLYRAAAAFSVDADAPPDEVARRILDRFSPDGGKNG